jgi:hypothetical protein
MYKHLCWPGHYGELSQLQRQLYQSGAEADVLLCTEDCKPAPAHAVILAAVSPVLRRLLVSQKTDTEPTQIIFGNGVHSTEVASLLRLLYKGETRIDSSDQLAGLKWLLDQLGIDGVTTELIREK